MLHVFHGKNTFLSRRSATEAFETAQTERTQKGSPYESRVLDASTMPANDIVAEIQTPSLFSQNKVVLLKRPIQNQEKERVYECLLEELTGKDRDTIDLIVWEDSKLSANLRIVKALKAKNAITEAPELNKRTFITWAQKEIDTADLSFSRPSIYLLAQRVNFNPERLTRELSKISLMDKREITEEDIETICPDTLEHTIWELIDSINDNNIPQAERKLDSILRRGNDPIYVLMMLARNLRIILLTKLMLESGASISEIARKIKAPPFTIAALQHKARATPIDRLVRMYEKLSNIDYAGKTGQLDIGLALDILLSVI